MELLKKTRKFNKLLQRGENVALTDIANLLCEVINANTYIVGRKGEVRCYSLLEDFECPVMRAKVLDKLWVQKESAERIIKERYGIVKKRNVFQRLFNIK